MLIQEKSNCEEVSPELFVLNCIYWGLRIDFS
jgi:hypothetical protein